MEGFLGYFFLPWFQSRGFVLLHPVKADKSDGGSWYSWATWQSWVSLWGAKDIALGNWARKDSTCLVMDAAFTKCPGWLNWFGTCKSQVRACSVQCLLYVGD